MISKRFCWLLGFLLFFGSAAFAQIDVITVTDSANAVTGRFAAPFTLKCGTNLTCGVAMPVLTIAGNNNGTVISVGALSGVFSTATPTTTPAFTLVPNLDFTSGVTNISLPPIIGAFSFNGTATASEFDYSSALNHAWRWHNTTTNVGAALSSPLVDLCANEYHGSASAIGCIQWQFQGGAGNDAASTFAFLHFGNATGQVTTSFPGPITAGNSGGAGAISLPQGTLPTFPANSFSLYSPTSIGTAYQWKVPAAAATGLVRGDNAAGIVTLTQAELSGGCTTSGSNVTTCIPATTAAQTGTYQVLASDFPAAGCGFIPVTSGTFTITLVASGSQPANGRCLTVMNYGTGVVTLARSGQNINGAAANLTGTAGSATSPTGWSITSDGSNYVVEVIGSVAGAVTVVGAGTLTSTALVTGGGSQTVQTPSATTTLSAGGALAVATSVSTGTAPACTAGTAGTLCLGKGTAPTGAVSTMQLYEDSTSLEPQLDTEGGGVGMVHYTKPGLVHATAQTASITTATLCAATAGACNQAGMYRIEWSFIQTGTAPGTPAPGSVTLQLTWTDFNATAHSAITVAMDDSASLVATSSLFTSRTTNALAWASGSFNITSNGSILQYATTYTAAAVGTFTYELDMTVTRLQ